VALLERDIGYTVRTVFAELLVCGDASGGRGKALHFDHVAFNRLSLLGERK
jgi:hypothetical protein